MYYDMSDRLKLDTYELHHFIASLVGFLCKQFQVKGYLTLKIMFELKENTMMIRVKYLLVDAPSSKNINIKRHVFNLLGTTLSMLYLSRNYPLQMVVYV